jgi:hypothetical protein
MSVSPHSCSQVGNEPEDGPIVEASHLKHIIEIYCRIDLPPTLWEIKFLQTPANKFTTAPRVYKLTNRDEHAKKMRNEGKKRKHT